MAGVSIPSSPRNLQLQLHLQLSHLRCVCPHRYHDNWLRRSVHGRPIAILPDFATKPAEDKEQAK